MLIKLAAYGTLAYVGYKYLQSLSAEQNAEVEGASSVRLAGGPLSDQARVQHSADAPPAMDPQEAANPT
jgi:hypothetical protein